MEVGGGRIIGAVSRKGRIWLTALWIALIVVVDPTFAGAAEPEKNWVFSLATIAPANSTYMKIARGAMDHVETKTKGKVRFKLFTGGVLGDEPQLVEKVRNGELTGVFVTAAGIGEISPEFGLLLLPRLFRSEKEVDYVRGKMFDVFADSFRQNGLDLILWADIGFAQIMSKHPIPNLVEMRKRKIWAWPGEKMFPKLAEFLGLQPIPVQLPGVLDALRSGSIDTVYANALGAVVMGWYREIQYIMKWDLVYGSAVLAVGLSEWSAVPDGIKKLVMDEIAMALPKAFEALRIDEETALKGISKRGVQVLQLEPAVEQEFSALSSDFQKKFVEGKPKLQKVLEQVNRHLKEYRSSTAKGGNTGTVYLASRSKNREILYGITPTHPSPLEGEGEGGGGVSYEPGRPAHRVSGDWHGRFLP